MLSCIYVYIDIFAFVLVDKVFLNKQPAVTLDEIFLLTDFKQSLKILKSPEARAKVTDNTVNCLVH